MMKTQEWLTHLSRTISFALHPLIVPTLAVIFMLFGHTVMSGISLGAKWFFVGIVALNTLVFPMLGVGLLRSLRVIPDLSLSEPRHRMIPMIIVALSYVSCAVMFSDVMMAFLIRRFLFAALGCVLLCMIVTPFWKISLHMTSIGGLLAMLFLINLSGFGQFAGLLLLFILLAGLLGSARLWLGYHNIWQVAAGVCGGFLITSGAILFM